MLHFNRIILKNWKNFGDVDIDLTDRMFIVGANASGKSNFLDAFRFLKDLSTDGLVKAIKARGGIKKIRNLNARNPNYVDVHVFVTSDEGNELVNWEYQLQFNRAAGAEKNIDVNISLEKVVRNGCVKLSRRYSDEGEDYITRQFTKLEQPASNKDFRTLYEGFKTISYVNIIPQMIREADAFVPVSNGEDYYGRNLLSHISSAPRRTQESRLKKINEVLRMTVPQFSELSFTQDTDGKPHLQVRYEHFRPQGAMQQEDQFSDGTLRLIGLLWAILDGNGLMLLEEPENYLHSEIVKQLPMFIANAQRTKKGITRQVIIVSHSFDILNTDTVSLNEIAVLVQEKEDTVVEIAENIPMLREKFDAGFTPADIVIPHVKPKGIAEGQLTLFDIT